MAVPSSALQVVPLAEANAAAVDSLFDQQIHEWTNRLKWDYRGPSRLLRDVLRKGELRGLAVMSGEQAVGFSFYVVESNRCSIGDLYVAPDWRAAGVDKLMVSSILSLVDNTRGIRRIESQSVSFGNDGADGIFKARGFSRYVRYFMISSMVPLSSSANLAGRPEAHSPSATGSAGSAQIVSEPAGEETGAHHPPADVRIRPWDEDDFGRAAKIIMSSYRGEDDAKINSQYCTEKGCGELLSILTDTIWCGQFMPAASQVAVCTRMGNSVGVLIASRISADTGHIGQISVLPHYQGRGIGRALIEATRRELNRRGVKSASLAVTSTNETAVNLYLSCGFETVHTFPVYCWQTP